MTRRYLTLVSATKRSARDAALSSVRALVDSLYRSARGVESKTGRTNAQIALLGFVVRHGPLSVNDVAALARTGQSTVSTVLTRLERERLVRRVIPPHDRRRVLVEATSAGRALLRRAPRRPTDELLRAIDSLTPAQAASVAKALGPLLRALHRRRTQPPMLFE